MDKDHIKAYMDVSDLKPIPMQLLSNEAYFLTAKNYFR